MAAVGIDLGTTNSAVAVLRGRPVVLENRFGNRTVPSAVGWDPDLEQLVVGIDAKNSPDLYSTVLSVKRKMGSGERVKIGPHMWLPEEVSAEILKVLKRQAEEKIGEPVTEAIITVPAYFQLAQKDATRRAGLANSLVSEFSNSWKSHPQRSWPTGHSRTRKYSCTTSGAAPSMSPSSIASPGH